MYRHQFLTGGNRLNCYLAHSDSFFVTRKLIDYRVTDINIIGLSVEEQLCAQPEVWPKGNFPFRCFQNNPDTLPDAGNNVSQAQGYVAHSRRCKFGKHQFQPAISGQTAKGRRFRP